MTDTTLVLCAVTGERLRPPRGAFDGEVFTPIFGHYASRAKVQLFDSEAFSASVAYFTLFETEALRSFYLSKKLRDTRFYSEPLTEPGAIIVGLKGCFWEFEKAQQKGKSV